MINSYFYKYGFEQLNDVISYKDAKEFNNFLKKKFKINKKIFINERTFLTKFVLFFITFISELSNLSNSNLILLSFFLFNGDIYIFGY